MGIGMIERGLNAERDLSISKIAGSGLLTTGRILYVKDSADSDMPEFKENVPATERFTAIQTALDACRNGTNDYVLVCPKKNATNASTVWSLDTVLSMNKSGVHLLGIGAIGSMINKPVQLTTTAASGAIIVGSATTHTDVVRGCEIGNIFMTSSGNTPTTVLNVDSTAPVHGLWVHDCQITAAITGSGIVNDVAEDGIGTRYDRCVFGQAASIWLSNHNMCLEVEAGGTRTYCNDCLFLCFADAVDVVFAEVAATPVYAIFDGCRFFNVPTNVLTFGIGGGTANTVMIWDCLFNGAAIAGETSTTRVGPSLSGDVAADTILNPGLSVDGAAAISS